MVLDGGRNQVPPLVAQLSGRAENSEVSAFSAAAGKNNFARFGAPDRRDAIAGVIEQGAGQPSDVMDAGRIAKNLAQIRQHGLAHRRVKRRRGIIIEVDRFHIAAG